MDKVYDQIKTEEKWYKFWEENNFFKPEVNPKGKPYTIILPPPNANADLHFGHAMYVIEDILIRYHRMKGDAALWLPGADHAGFETQVVFEKKLQDQGKSRFDYGRETLYQIIWDFVQKNKLRMENQLKRLGFSLDWSREKFTLDPDIIKIVYQTFKALFDDNLVYRANRLINYCTKNGTSFSDLEVLYIEKKDQLFFLKYPLTDGSRSITVATTRPETMLGDSAVAVNPKDTRYKNLVGKKVKLPLVGREIKIIADEVVNQQFGTGAIKVTPAHDPLDYAIGQRHNLEQISVLGFDGKLLPNTGKYSGSEVLEARKAVVEDLKKAGLVDKIEDYTHRVGTCYKCGSPVEPLLLEQWFIRVEPLAKEAAKAVKQNKVKIYPTNFTKIYFQWMENIRDWNISRQIVWGIRIPAWRCLSCNEWTVTEGQTPDKCIECSGKNLEQDPDTFDTWFSSGQWPYATLQTTKKGDFEKFYPTTVMETGFDILFFWVARMVMLGLYSTKEVPFKEVVLHGLVKDPLGQKMSKSKGNVVSPIEIANQYGADAARMALIFGTALGHNQVLSHPKLQAMRNFTNKLWNIGRFIIEFKPKGSESLNPTSGLDRTNLHPDDEDILNKLADCIRSVTKAIDSYFMNAASGFIYTFIWHTFADKYVEKTKSRRAQAQPTLEYVFKTSLELLHPFMPFITEELWQKLRSNQDLRSIMITQWPEAKSE